MLPLPGGLGNTDAGREYEKDVADRSDNRDDDDDPIPSFSDDRRTNKRTNQSSAGPAQSDDRDDDDDSSRDRDREVVRKRKDQLNADRTGADTDAVNDDPTPSFNDDRRTDKRTNQSSGGSSVSSSTGGQSNGTGESTSGGGILDTIRDTFDRALGNTDEQVAQADTNPDVVETATGSGGVLSADANSNDGLIPGRVAGIDVSESRARDVATDVSDFGRDIDAGATFSSPADPLSSGLNQGAQVGSSTSEDPQDTPGEAAIEGLITTATELPNAALGVETALETIDNADKVADEFDSDTVAETGVAIARDSAVGAAESAVNDPFRFAGSVAGEVVLGAGASKVAGTVGRAAIDRKRTAGATRVEASELTSDDVLSGETRFPGADDPGQYRSDPASAVIDQSNANTPDSIGRRLDEANARGEADLKKALDRPIEDPEGGDSFGVPDDVADAYESPGSFVGPELSPNFLRVGDTESSVSLRPGFPDLSGRPTAAVVRADVENSAADDLDGFNQELLDRAGDDVAIAKPSSDVNPGEIEAVVPPGARFADVDGGRAEFYTEIGGRRVPIRTFGNSDVDVGSADNVFDGLDDALSRDSDRGVSFDEIDRDVTERVQQSTDNALPMFGIGSSGRGNDPLDSSRGAPSSTPRSSPSSSPSPFDISQFGFPSSGGSGNGSDTDPFSDPSSSRGSPGGTPSSSSFPPTGGSISPSGNAPLPGSIPTALGGGGRRPRLDEFDRGRDDDSFGERSFDVFSKTFDTGVVQSLDELSRRGTDGVFGRVDGALDNFDI
ncbi:hypothetical protein [Haloferax marisrubri]|uniref:hypothetical protein n=1 Tax=Haloferax marisrubri TaxID=1544719 RepID=UPI000AC8C871|nr:hypothetical protein [Haloferax marisrubri]